MVLDYMVCCFIFVISILLHKYELHSSISIEMSSESDNNSRRGKQERSRSRSRERRRQHLENKQRERDRDRGGKIKMKSPDLSNQLLTFHHFCNIQTEKFNSQSLQKGYEKYKKEWQHKQNEDFLKQYKKDAWFAEKYDPQVLDLLERDRKQNNKRLNIEFLAKLDDGFYDRIDLRVVQPSQLGVVEQFDEEEEQNTNLNLGYIMNQTFDIHLNQSLDITKHPYFGFDSDVNTLFIKSVPRLISRYDIRGVVQKLEGYKCLTMSDPVKRNGLKRYCWIEFDSQENTNKALLSLSGLMIKNETIVVSKSVTKVKRVKILKNYPISRIEADIDTLLRLIIKLDQQTGIHDSRLIQREYATLQAKFDTFLLYLRKVHAYDYFTSSIFENERILSLKVGSAFLRIEADYQQLQNVQTVFKKIQENSQLRIAKGSQVPDYMGFLRDEIEKFIRESEKLQKDQQKQVWKCMFCDKKFKTCEFLVKHMISKHQEIKFKKIQIIMEQLYFKDPFKITFSSLGGYEKNRGKGYGGSYRKQRRRDYKDFDEPENDKPAKSTTGGKSLVNFLDI